jgi:hypothetical protein
MLRNYVAPGIRSADFLTPDGLALSVGRATSTKREVSWIMGDVRWFKHIDIHWLAREVGYHILWDWFDEWDDREERATLDKLTDKLWAWPQSETIISDTLELITFMKDLVVKYWEKFYNKMLAFDAGEKETDAGNNRMYQSSRLGECILLWIRFGVDSTVIELWKSKLKEEDSRYISENIFPEDFKY